MNGHEQFTLLPYLDWPVSTYADGGGVASECEQLLPALQGNGLRTRCGFDLRVHDSPRELLEAIRRHAAEVEHLYVSFRLEVESPADLDWTDDVRRPGAEEIALAGTTPDGSYWVTSSGHPEPARPGDDRGAQHFRVITVVER